MKPIPGMSRTSLAIRSAVFRVQMWARRYGLEVHRFWPMPQSPNLLALAISDVLLGRVLAGGQPSDFTFLQIGANDGIANDPLHPFIVRYGFRGVCVEPMAEPFARLQWTYRDHPGVVCERAAIGPTDGEVTLYRFIPGPHLPPWADHMASISPEVLRANFQGLRGAIEPVTVPSMTVATLRAKYGLGDVDLLQLDAEGYDFEIIKLVDLTTFRPTILHFEPGMLTPAIRHECFRHLHQHGYTVAANGTDALAYLEPPEQALVSTDIYAAENRLPITAASAHLVAPNGTPSCSSPSPRSDQGTD